jgi:hypothetical protein
MATTALFVEILVMGALAELWFVGAILALLDTSELRQLVAAVVSLKDFAALLATVALALTYAIGWVLNFVAERLFKKLFERRVRDRLFAADPKNYDQARAFVFQRGSGELLRDLLLDRHIVRIARSNVLNFTLIALAFLLNTRHIDPRVAFLLIVCSLGVALLSFTQWRTRYESYYGKVAASEKMLRAADLAIAPERFTA